MMAQSDKRKFNLRDFSSAFVIWIAGLSLAVLAFACELIKKKHFWVCFCFCIVFSGNLVCSSQNSRLEQLVIMTGKLVGDFNIHLDDSSNPFSQKFFRFSAARTWPDACQWSRAFPLNKRRSPWSKYRNVIKWHGAWSHSFSRKSKQFVFRL